MAIDSTANLLFTVAADSSDATGNIARFRALLGKDLKGIGEEFAAWSKKVFGDLSTVKGALVAGTAALAAGTVAVGAALFTAAQKASAYALEIDSAKDATGIAHEELSKLKFSAKAAGVEFGQLKVGLVQLVGSIDAVRRGSAEQTEAFRRLGVSRADVADGARDLLPLLYKLADGFAANRNAVEKAAIARQLFGKQGTELIGFLNQGSAGIQAFNRRAAELGLVLGEKDVLAAKAFKLQVMELNAQLDALWLSMGKTGLPVLTRLALTFEALMESARKTKVVVSPRGGALSQLLFGIGSNFSEEFENARKRLEAQMKAAAGAAGTGSGAPGGKEARAEFEGLSNLLEQVRGRMAGLGTEEERIAFQTAHLQKEVKEAAARLRELAAEGKISGEVLKRELGALARLPAEIEGLATEEMRKVLEERDAAMIEAARDLESRIGAQAAESFENRKAAFGREIALLREKLEIEGNLTAENLERLAELERAGRERIDRERERAVTEAALDLESRIAGFADDTFKNRAAALRREVELLRRKLAAEGSLTEENQKRLVEVEKAGLAKIGAERAAAFARLLRDLQQELAAILSARMTTRERLEFDYQRDLERFSEVEETKALVVAKTEAEADAIRAQFALNRAAATSAYEGSLNALRNSTGWRGVFGEEFAAAIRGNEELLREWAESANQASMLVRVAFESLSEMGQRAFQGLARGMAANVAQAFMYKQSIGEAMRAALAATLQSIAAEAGVQAIYATALGFLRLAQRDFASAASAFKAAAIFGSVGVAAAVAGRAVAPRGKESSAISDQLSAGGRAQESEDRSQESRGPRVAIYVQGHVIGRSGIEEITEMINDAVAQRDVRLVATQVSQATRLVR